MKYIYLFSLLSFILMTNNNVDAQVHYSTKGNITGNWMEQSSWEDLPSWQSWANPMPGKTVSGYVSSVTINGTIIYRASNGQDLKFSGSTDIIVNDTLIIETGLDGLAGASLTVNAGGVIIVVGDTKLGGAFNVDNSGDVVFVGHVNMSGGTNISNNGNLYAFDGINTGGGSGYSGIPSPVPNEGDLQNENSDLYDIVQSAVNGTLPIELLYFELKLKNEGICIEWGTASEINNDYFTLQRSLDGSNYTDIAEVNGSGTTNTLNSYQYLDKKDKLEGNIYYRLKQTDFNGASRLFSPQSIEMNNIFNRINFVNISKSGNMLNLELKSGKDKKIELFVFSVNGQIVHKSGHNIVNGHNTIGISNISQKTSTYIFHLKSDNFLLTKKAIL